MEDRKTHPNDYINPMNFEYSYENEGIPSLNTITSFGLTKREYFAAMAMQGLMENYPNSFHNPIQVVNTAVSMADWLIEELNK